MQSVSTFGAFTTARLGMYAAQKGLDITGHNITNINTIGYTRQSLSQISLRTGGNDRYQSMFDAPVGSGVLCTGVTQLRDPYLDIRFRNEQASVGAMDSKLAGLESLSQILDEVGKGDGSGVIEKQ
ncbi:MAG: flagellar hook-associated protein FlgK, partial [Oscillospiraceae bacterium]